MPNPLTAGWSAGAGRSIANAPGNFIGQSQQMLSGARESGILDPLGSKRIRDILRRRAMMGRQSGMKRAGILSQLYGLDPSQTRAGLLNADIAGTGGMINALTEADYNELTANRPFYQGLFSGGLQHQQAMQLAKMQQDAERRGGIGNVLGSVGGQILGRYLP
jgi:hypothetical protein